MIPIVNHKMNNQLKIALYILEMLNVLRKEARLKLCASLGIISYQQALNLKHASIIRIIK